MAAEHHRVIPGPRTSAGYRGRQIDFPDSPTRRAAGVIVAFAAAIALCGCDGSTASNPRTDAERFAGEYPIRIVATTGMVADIVRRVAGEHATVTALMRPGTDPHMHKANRDDVQLLSGADIIFYSGLHLEGRMADTLASFGRTKPVYAVAEAIAVKKLRAAPDLEGHYDPHMWMDVSLWSECVEFVARTLCAFDPPHADEYRASAATYRDELDRLDDYVRRVIASIPESQRVLVTSHDAFGYFGRAYRLEVNSVQGITTEAEAALAEVNALVDFIVQRKIPAIFVESSVSPKNIEHVREACRSKGWEVRLGGELFSDAMGEEGTYEGTYVGMIDHNATMIARALGGEAPEGGMDGRLGRSASGNEAAAVGASRAD